MRSYHRSTKIVATIGPASDNDERIRSLISAGLNVARVNGSHGDHETHARVISRIRQAATELNKTVGILFDLQGPKIRLGMFEGERVVRAGDVLCLAVAREPEGEELPTDYDELDRDVMVGHRLLIDDGNVATEVVGIRAGRVRCRVLNDGKLLPRKGINLPDTNVSTSALTTKDRQDAAFAIEQGVDMIALSFVRRAEDVGELQEILDDAGVDIPIIAKIEKPQALDNLMEILRVSWGVMVARGDLGVELSPEEVPLAQKRIITEARQLQKPVITATQMLESMTRNPRPTRAEASDVANAVLDGTDAVMLSAETASGRYPTEAVSMMVRIIEATEHHHKQRGGLGRRLKSSSPVVNISRSVVDSGAAVAEAIEAKGIIAYTGSGSTAVTASSQRPQIPILAFSPDPKVRNRLALVWGVTPYPFNIQLSTEEMVSELDRVLIRENLGEWGDHFVVLMGGPARKPGRTYGMLVHPVGSLHPDGMQSSGSTE